MRNTVLEALEQYQQTCNKKEVDNVRSLIKKHLLSDLLPLWGLQSLQGKKISCILDRATLSGFVKIADRIFQQKLLQLENPNTRKVMKSRWKRFCQWLEEQEWYPPELPRLESAPVMPNHAFTHLPKGITYKPKKARPPGENYGLKKTELTPKIKQQLQGFHRFCQTPTRQRQHVNRRITQDTHQARILRFLGWMKNIEGFSISDLDLAQMTDLSLLKKYEQWQEQRGMASITIKSSMLSCKLVFQSLNQDLSQKELNRAIEPVRNFVNTIPDRKDRPHASDAAYGERVLERQEYEVIISYLGWRCKDLQEQYGVTNEVIDAWMDYLIIALLFTTGVRQREIRELCPKRLVQDSDGLYSVTLEPDDHKNGSKTGKGRGYPLFVGPYRKQLCCDLTYYLEQIRPQDLGHDYLFFIRQANTVRNGVRYRGDRILDSSCLTKLVPKLIYRVSAHLFGPDKAKRTSCHDFRRITATWVGTYGKPTHFPSYAEMLGNSEQMLRKRYAKIHPGVLAAQVSTAYEEIAENEKRVTQRLRATEPKLRESIPQTPIASDGEQVELIRSLLQIMWLEVPKAKRSGILQILTPAQHQFLQILQMQGINSAEQQPSP